MKLWIDGAISQPHRGGPDFKGSSVTLVSPEQGSRCHVERRGDEMWTMHGCGNHDLVIIKWQDFDFNDYTPLVKDNAV